MFMRIQFTDGKFRKKSRVVSLNTTFVQANRVQRLFREVYGFDQQG